MGLELVFNLETSNIEDELRPLTSTIVFHSLYFHLVYSLLAFQYIYSSLLSTNNQIYSRYCDKNNFYYESIQVKVIKGGYYRFRSYSTIDAYGSIYKNTFNPLNPSENLLQTDGDSSSDLQFKLDIPLSADMTYVLVMATDQLEETSLFSIIVQGAEKVILERLSKYMYNS